jgi:hypothetical protein
MMALDFKPGQSFQPEVDVLVQAAEPGQALAAGH